MSVLGKKPFNLKSGMPIRVRANAENEFGKGPDSAVNSITNVVLAPTQIVNPELVSETADSIKFEWSYDEKVPGTQF